MKRTIGEIARTMDDAGLTFANLCRFPSGTWGATIRTTRTPRIEVLEAPGFEELMGLVCDLIDAAGKELS